MLLGRRAVSARACYFWFQGSWSFLHQVAFTLLLVYQVQTAQLSPFQMIITGTVMEATCFLAEVPTGIVADLYSRRLSVLIGALVVGAGILLQGVFPAFGPILIGNIVWGVGYTFISGALEAWITDEVGRDAVLPLFTRYQQLQLALNVLGTIAAGAIGIIDLRLPMIIAGSGYLLLALIMSQLMPERGFTATPRNERETYAQLRRILLDGLRTARRHRIVRSFLIIALLTGLSSEVFDRLWTAHLLNEFDLPEVAGITNPALWFTIFALIGSLIALVANLSANRVAGNRINALHPSALMAVLILIQVAGVVGFSLAGSLWPALAAMWIRNAAQSVAAPIRAAWLARNISSSSRATTISLTSQADAIGQVIGGPPLGAVASKTSIPVALLLSAAILLPASLVYARLRPEPDHERQRVPD